MWQTQRIIKAWGVVMRFGKFPILARFALATALTLISTTFASAHGGGCRKSSPPGQCCHMDNKAGSVHCH